MHEAHGDPEKHFGPHHGAHRNDGASLPDDTAPLAAGPHGGAAADGEAPAAPNEMAQVARRRMQLHPHLKLQRIWCEVRGRRLFLRGQVPSFYHKQLAQASLKDMDGLEQIVNEIEVVW